MDHLLSGLLHWTTRGIEVAGTVVIVFGILMAAYAFARDLLRGRSSAEAFRSCRSSLGMAILLGLELLVAADIISTVAIEPSLESLAVLAGIVVIRTFLSFSLEVEIEGRWPWQAPAKAEGGVEQKAERNKA
ncbi:DUF1622 domain-containing protein [Xanthobacter variabilis]|uniref:DUF1622 domain-containing protein n=1 Tax=Xanthobacter variabilis TaxID=3119932 RepID=UPI003726E25C